MSKTGPYSKICAQAAQTTFATHALSTQQTTFYTFPQLYNEIMNIIFYLIPIIIRVNGPKLTYFVYSSGIPSERCQLGTNDQTQFSKRYLITCLITTHSSSRVRRTLSLIFAEKYFYLRNIENYNRRPHSAAV